MQLVSLGAVGLAALVVACSFDPSGVSSIEGDAAVGDDIDAGEPADASASIDASEPIDAGKADAMPKPDASGGLPDAAPPKPDAAVPLPDASPPGECGPNAEVASLTVGVTVTGSTAGQPSGAASGTSCGGASSGEDIWIVDLDALADLTITTALPGTQFNTALYVRSSCTDAASLLGCQSQGNPGDTLTLPARPPGRYYVFVDGLAGASGSYALRATVKPIRADGEACDPAGLADRCDDGSSCQLGPGGGFVCAAGQLSCEGAATSVSLGAAGQPIAGTTVGLDGYAPSCSGASGPERVYRGVVPMSGGPRDLVADVTSTSMLDPLVELTDVCGDPGGSADCSDAAEGAGSSEVAVVNNVQSGDTWYAVVDGAGGSAGAFALDLYLRQVRGQNQACDRTLRTSRCASGVCVDGIDLNTDADCNTGVPVVEDDGDNDDACGAFDGPQGADFSYQGELDPGLEIDVVKLSPGIVNNRLAISVYGPGGSCPLDLSLALLKGDCKKPTTVATSTDEGIGPCPFLDVAIAPNQEHWIVISRGSGGGTGMYTMVVDFIP